MFWYHHVKSTAGNPLAVHVRFTGSVSLINAAVGSSGGKISAGAMDKEQNRNQIRIVNRLLVDLQQSILLMHVCIILGEISIPILLSACSPFTITVNTVVFSPAGFTAVTS